MQNILYFLFFLTPAAKAETETIHEIYEAMANELNIFFKQLRLKT